MNRTLIAFDCPVEITLRFVGKYFYIHGRKYRSLNDGHLMELDFPLCVVIRGYFRACFAASRWPLHNSHFSVERSWMAARRNQMSIVRWRKIIKSMILIFMLLMVSTSAYASNDPSIFAINFLFTKKAKIRKQKVFDSCRIWFGEGGRTKGKVYSSFLYFRYLRILKCFL